MVTGLGVQGYMVTGPGVWGHRAAVLVLWGSIVQGFGDTGSRV